MVSPAVVLDACSEGLVLRAWKVSERGAAVHESDAEA